jgi:hypothetical protein
VKVDGSLKSLLQGVSQQPARDRLDGQATLQDNFSSDPVSGLTRRAPTDLVNYLGATGNVKGWHQFETNDGGKWIALFHDATVTVYDLNGEMQTVTMDDDDSAEAYIGASIKIRAYTDDENRTMFTNPNYVAEMTTDTASYLNEGTVHSALIQVLGGAYGRTYKIYMNGVPVAEYQAPDGSVATHAAEIDTVFIADYLADELRNNISNDFDIRLAEDIICVTHFTDEFRLTASDGSGNINIKCMNQTVDDVADLPRLAPHLYIARVAEKTDPEKDLWYRFIVEAYEGSATPNIDYFGQTGYWQEATAPGVPTNIDVSTMPHTLTYDLDTGEFSCGPSAWEPRKVGTLVSNPNPSFIGNTINDISSFQGRSVLITGANVCMSRSNKPYDHWMGSAAALADTDPIDINSKVESSVIISAVQHNRDLVLFSQTAQFIVYGRNKITPDTAALTVTTKFESETGAHPIGAGRNIFFAANYGSYTAMREFYAEGSTDINDSRPITQHIKKYIKGKALHITASANYDMCLVHTDTEQTTLHVYQYIWSDSEKVQAAWSKWKFKWPVVWSFFDEDRIYLVQKINTEYYLLRLPLDIQASGGITYPVMLDQRYDVLGCYSAFLMPFTYMINDTIIVVQGENCPNPGMRVPVKSILWDADYNGYRVTLKKDMLGGDIVVGSPYRSEYWPTMPSVKDSDDVVVGTGTLNLRMFILSLFNTGEITGQVKSKYGDGEPVTFNSRIVGSIDNVVGQQPIATEKFLMPFRMNVDQAEISFYTESHLPLTILDIEWQGQYSKKGKRV